jgi:hypothetical protein
VACDTPDRVMAVPHPFIQDFFLGPRGQRAGALLRPAPL